MNARKPGYEARQQEKRVRNYVRLNRFFVNTYMSQRRQWHGLKLIDRLTLLIKMADLKNELSRLGEEILQKEEIDANIIPFPVRPPS